MSSSTRETLPLLPIRGGLILPHQRLAIPVGRRRSRKLLRELSPGDHVLLAAQRDARSDDPTISDLFPIVTRAVVRAIQPEGRFGRILVEGVDRRELVSVDKLDPWYEATVDVLVEPEGEDVQVRTALDAARFYVDELGANADKEAREALDIVAAETDPGAFADRLAPLLGLPFEAAIQVLLAVDKGERLERLLTLTEELELNGTVKADVNRRMREELGQAQREQILRARMKAIQDELGDGDEGEDNLKSRLDAKDLPGEVRKTVDRELKRLDRGSGPEQGVARSYLEWIADLPWSERAEATEHSIAEVAAQLDENHQGLDDVKERILEHLAVRKRAKGKDITILCLAGPPGTGKTSLGQSVADALGRPLVRVALGGVRDEAEIRGHRRTYVGARPGRVVHALKQAAVKNPVFLLDEIDKMGRGWAGDPEAALLEVLDPEQNANFTDHYLELPFDLSEVLFLCTANDLSQLSAPLRDRLEIIELSGYVTDEKIEIARSHLVPRALERVGLEEVKLEIDDALLRDVVEGWTREAGVRQLTRALEKIARAQLLKLARAGEDVTSIAVEEADVTKALGRRRFFPEVKERTSLPGIATGLAWTPVGGDILFIETSRSRGKGRLEVTGQLGDVMTESSKAALAWVRAHAADLGFDVEELEQTDLHIHVPQGGVPKDGPSAGVTMVTALASLMSGRKVRADTAMTGEVTLRGRVLPVGGIKSKILAAHRAGIERVVLPRKNERDLDDVPERVREEMTFFFADEVEDVLEHTLEQTLEPAVDAGLTPGFEAGFDDAVM